MRDATCASIVLQAADSVVMFAFESAARGVTNSCFELTAGSAQFT